MKSLILRVLVCSGCFLAASSLPLLAQSKSDVAAPIKAAAKAPIKATAKATVKVAPAASLDVELFAGIAGGQLEVKFIPKSDREGKLFVKNLTKQPLSVRMPEALAARPVLAQAGFGFGAPQGGNARVANTPQAVGIPGANNGATPMNRNGNGNGFFGNGNQMNGNNFFNVAPERLVEVKLDTVCLEHGKKDPRAQVPYQICRLDEITAKPGVSEILKQLGAGTLDQRSSQAAVWHLACDMSWDDLAAKRIEHLNEPSELYFTGEQLQSAQAAVEKPAQPDAKSEKSVAAESSADVR